jgi:transposase
MYGLRLIQSAATNLELWFLVFEFLQKNKFKQKKRFRKVLLKKSII